MKAFEHHHLAACEAANAHHAGQTKIVEVMGCKWSIIAVEASKNGNEWGPPRLTLEPVTETIAERVRRGLAAIGGLQFVSPTVAFADDQLTDDRAAEIVGAMTKKPAPTWDGEGLPPVGCVCEYKRVNDWVKVEVFAIKPNYNGSYTALCTFENGTRVGCANPGYFRPIRTAEQIAAAEREKAIERMFYAVPVEPDHQEIAMGICTALYNMGARLPDA